MPELTCRGTGILLAAALLCAIFGAVPARATESVSADGFQINVGNAIYRSNSSMSAMQPAIGRDGRMSPSLASLKDGGYWVQNLLQVYVAAYKTAQVKTGIIGATNCGAFCDMVVFAESRDGAFMSFNGTNERGYVGYAVPNGAKIPPTGFPGAVEDVRALATLVATVRANPGITQMQLTDAVERIVKPPVVYYRGPTEAALSPIPPPPPPPPRETPLQPITYVGPHLPPVYPGLALLEGYTGRVVVQLEINADGDVTDSRVENATFHHVLDDAALKAARSWKFNSTDAAHSPRVVRIPINFSLNKFATSTVALASLASAKTGQGKSGVQYWPQGYLHPRYVAAKRAVRYANPAAALKALSQTATQIQIERNSLLEFVPPVTSGTSQMVWFVMNPGTPHAIAVRYMFAGTPANPVVEVSALCAKQMASCESVMPVLLMGPVFAR